MFSRALCLYSTVIIIIHYAGFSSAADFANITGTDGPVSLDANSTTAGWTSGPNGRGSWEIITSCLLTILLCSYNSLCMNAAGVGETVYDQYRDKLSMTILSVIGPEFILMISMGQHNSAQCSVKQFHASGYTKWTLRHAFFADMGGFVLQCPDFVPFPINARQLHYLVEQGYVDYPKITEAEIADKNKVNGIARLATLGQAAWFAVNSFARLAQHIGITLGELTTLSFIFCTMVTSYFWRFKPADVESPVIIVCDIRIAEILLRAGDDAKLSYHSTPLDFLNPSAWSWNRLWSLWRVLMRSLKIEWLWFRPLGSAPLKRFPDDICPELPAYSRIMFRIVSLMYCAIFLAAWNNHFPTDIERFLWRMASATQFGGIAVAFVFEAMTQDIPYTRNLLTSGTRSGTMDIEMLPNGKPRKSYREWFRNVGAKQNPDLRLSVTVGLTITICAFFYMFSRAYILVEDIASIRLEPSEIYKTVEWVEFLPHL